MRLHVAKHILSLNNGLNVQTCGYCGRIGHCNISLKAQKHGTNIPFSNCPYYYNFSLKSADNVVKSNPCTNRPEHFLICASDFWTYNFAPSFKNSHLGLKLIV